MAISSIVTSIGVPTLVMVENSLSYCPFDPEDHRDHHVGVDPLAHRVLGHLVQQFFVERGEFRVGGDGELARDPAAEHRPYVCQVDDQGGEPARVQAQPHQVHRWSQQIGRDAREERVHRAVGQHDVPAAVERQRRIRLVRLEHPADRVEGSRQSGVVERTLRVPGCEAGGEQQPIAIPQRDVELVGEPQDHVRARCGPPGLDQADVTSRDVRGDRQVELAEPPALPPLPQECPDRVHDQERTHRRAVRHEVRFHRQPPRPWKHWGP